MTYFDSHLFEILNQKWKLPKLLEFSFPNHYCFDRFNFLLFLSTDLSLACLSQFLLKPIVSQFVIQPPTSLEENPNIPSMKEVDDLLVVCIGRMAVTAGTDLLWKPLNHEVSLKAITLVCGNLSNARRPFKLNFLGFK
jgi:hypothetical protein